MKKVFSSNAECIHVFAQNIQSQGKANSVFFYGDTLYSYGYHFPLAKFINDNLVWINDTSYSNSTSKHQNLCYNAFRQYQVILESNHNIEKVVYHLKHLKDKTLKARKPWMYINEALGLIDSHKQAQTLWPNVANQIKATEELAELTQFFEGSQDSEALQKAKTREQEKRAKNAELFKHAFYSYEPFGELRRKAQLNYDLVRISENGLYLETSQDVKVEISAAKALLRAYKSGVDVVGQKIDYYQIRAIQGDRVLIGCHNLKISEIERALK